jgi:hypothetical protein
MTHPRCTRCGRFTFPQERAAYGGRCEDCWTYETPGKMSEGRWDWGAAISYTGDPLGVMSEVSYQGPKGKQWRRSRL